MRSARSITKPMSCSTSSTDMPPSRNCRNSAASRCFSMCAGPPPARRATAASGRRTAPRAISTMRCWPSESAAGELVDLVGEPDALDLPRGFRQQPRFVGAVEPQHMLEIAPECPRRCAPIATFSSTVMSGTSLTCWKVRATPSFTTSCGGALSTLWPSTEIVPPVAVRHAGDQVEGGALAGAVRADQRHDLARPGPRTRHR